MIFECVVNVSEGRDERVLAELAAAAGPALLDLHRDPDHNRSVLTLAGPADAGGRPPGRWPPPRWPGSTCAAHQGAHPRLGVLDVVPFVPYEPGRPAPEDLSDAVALRDDFARWLGAELGVPSFLYGPLPGGRTRTLPDIRRAGLRDGARTGLTPDFGPPQAGPADRGDRGRRPAGPGRLQRLGLLGRGGPPGGAPGAGPARARAGPGRRARGPRCRAT